MLEDGVLTDSLGRKADFRNAIIIMTSNLGAPVAGQAKRALGFRGADENARDRAAAQAEQERIETALKATFRPEFLNRIDATVIFDALKRAELEQILGLLLARTEAQLTSQGLELSLTAAARHLLLDAGYDVRWGARPMRRAITNLLEDPLADGLLQGHFRPDATIYVDADEGKLTFSTQAPGQLLMAVAQAQ